MNTKHSSYLHDLFESKTKFKKTVQTLKATVLSDEVKSLNIDSIVCTGVSGLAVASAVCYLTNKNLVIVRKPGVASHASYLVEGLPTKKPLRYIFLDDFISSGETVKRVILAINNEIGKENAHFCGLMLYSYDVKFYNRKESFDRYKYTVFGQDFIFTSVG